MSKKFEYPIEKFIYNDEYTNEDLKILELDSHDIINTADNNNNNNNNKEEEIVINTDIKINEDDKPKEELNKQNEE